MKSLCLISGSSPNFLGGISLYQKNLIKYFKKKKSNLNFTWIYPGSKDREYNFEGINCIEVNSLKYPILKEFDFSKKVKKIITKRNFDIINTHANWGYCLNKYHRKRKQNIVHTYHGVTIPYIKIQFSRFKLLKYLFYPIFPFIYLIEKVPMKKANEIICVSEKVKREIEYLYGKRKNISVIRTGVDLSKFKKLPNQKSKKELNLDNERIYGLYSGRGGYWNKGLDRAISLGKELYNRNKEFRLIVIGADKNKCKKYLNLPFVLYRGLIKRKNLPKYYSISDFFFSLSRYEGGAPTLVLSEAISSECLIICSKDTNTEILKNNKDCLILKDYSVNGAELILKILKNKSSIINMKSSAKKKINKLSIKKWGKKYSEVLLK